MGGYFIAYSRRDFYFAESLFYALQGNKDIDAWMDVWKIVPGANWGEEIFKAIDASDGVILVATKDSLRSTYVRDEICYALQNDKSIYVVIRGRIPEDDLRFEYINSRGKPTTVYLNKSARAVIDIRAQFERNVERLVECLTQNAQITDKLPGALDFKRERILYVPPLIVLLVLLMVVTEIWRYGIQIIYGDQIGRIIALIRDVWYGQLKELLVTIPEIISTIATFGALGLVIWIGINIIRRRRVSDAQLYLLLFGSAYIVLYILIHDVFAIIFELVVFNYTVVPSFLATGEHAPSLDMAPIVLLVAHAALALLIVGLGIALYVALRSRNGQGKILRWLPTGWASPGIRRSGNERLIAKLPNTLMATGPNYPSYYVESSPEDAHAAAAIKAMLLKQGYHVVDNQVGAACDIILLSPYSPDGALKRKNKPTIYVLARSVHPSKDTSIALQWIDYRRATPNQFWNQWAKNLANLKARTLVFPFVPESVTESVFPTTSSYGFLLIVIMFVLEFSCALMIWALDRLILVQNALNGWMLVGCVVCFLAAMCLGYAVIVQILRGVISVAQVNTWFGRAALLTLVAVFLSQNRVVIITGFVVVVANVVVVWLVQSGMPHWIPVRARKLRGSRKLMPISTLSTIANPIFSLIMIVFFLVANAQLTDQSIIPYLPQQSVAQSYSAPVPGVYTLSSPGRWEQDTYGQGLGYHFDYHLDHLTVSQDEASGYPTWLKFDGSNFSSTHFAPHFRASIHVHFTNSDTRTFLDFSLNDVGHGVPGPHFMLSSKGSWLVLTSKGQQYFGLLQPNEVSHDYTMTIEVNGILCIYQIGEDRVTTFVDPSVTTVKDIMFLFSNNVPGGTNWTLSNFMYTPVPGPALSQSEANAQINALRMTPYSTKALGWKCNPADGRWNANFEPRGNDTSLTCTAAGTQLIPSSTKGINLNFTNDRYGGLPSSFDYSFDVTYQGGTDQCIYIGTYANLTLGINYRYWFRLCADGTWGILYVGDYSNTGKIFLAKGIKSGHLAPAKTAHFLVNVRGSTLSFNVNDTQVATINDSRLFPSLIISDSDGPALLSNFSYDPHAQA